MSIHESVTLGLRDATIQVWKDLYARAGGNECSVLKEKLDNYRSANEKLKRKLVRMQKRQDQLERVLESVKVQRDRLRVELAEREERQHEQQHANLRREIEFEQELAELRTDAQAIVDSGSFYGTKDIGYSWYPDQDVLMVARIRDIAQVLERGKP